MFLLPQGCRHVPFLCSSAISRIGAVYSYGQVREIRRKQGFNPSRTSLSGALPAGFRKLS